MNSNLFDIYDMLIDGIVSDEIIDGSTADSYWSFVSAGKRCGIAMTTEGSSIRPMYPEGMKGISLKKAAIASKSWNLEEASYGCAAINAYYNSPENMERLGCFRPFERHYSEEIDFRGRTVGVIGHLKDTSNHANEAKELYILERNPKSGDYPDSACDYILPRCDLVVITGSSLVNKTLPHLLELCPDATKILTGPSVPMCPGLLEFGFDMLCGMIIDDRQGLLDYLAENNSCSPFRFGKPFMIKK